MANIKCEKCGNYIDEKNKDNCPACGGKGELESAKITTKKEKSPQPVKVVDFNMEFGSMVTFMVKWVIASIPAMIILFLIWMALMMIFGGTVAGLMRI